MCASSACRSWPGHRDGTPSAADGHKACTLREDTGSGSFAVYSARAAGGKAFTAITKSLPMSYHRVYSHSLLFTHPAYRQIV
jgi:hypothetical protein